MTPPVNGNTALFLDIDGTLLDLARTPDAVVVPPTLLAALARLQQELSGALAFVSGRPLAAIDKLFAPLKPASVGCHGAELRDGQGRTRALAQPVSERLRALFARLAAAHPGVLLEDKIYGLALHYRLAPEAKPALCAALQAEAALLAAEGVTLMEGKAVIDARPIGIDKGVGLRALMEDEPFAGRQVLFGGDDTTDLDVFRLLPSIGGAGFSVGRHYPGVDHVFASPLAVRQWLTRLAEAGVAA